MYRTGGSQLDLGSVVRNICFFFLGTSCELVWIRNVCLSPIRRSMVNSGGGIQRSAVVLAEVGDAVGAIVMTDNDIICR